MPEHITIGDVSPRIQYTGDGSQTQFTYSFPIFADADMEVYLDDALQATGFTVAGAGESQGGTVAFDAAPANGVKVTLRRRLSVARASDFQEAGEFRAKVINDELDFLTACVQQVADDVGRGVLLHATDSAASMTLPAVGERSGKMLGFDTSGNIVATDGVPGPQGPTGAAGADGVFSGNEALATPEGGDKFALFDASSSNNPKVATLTSMRDAVAGTSASALVQLDGSAKLPAVDGSQLTGVSPVDDTARANIVLNAFRIAVNGGLSIQNMVDGVVDEFEDETGVDAAASTDEAYDATDDYYAPTAAGYTSDQVPTMTSASAPSGTVTGSASWGGYDPWKALDDTTSDWYQSNASQSGWIAYEFTSAKTIARYTVSFNNGNDYNRAPKDWTFDGWNGSGWDTLDTVSGQTSWSTSQKRTFDIDTPASYSKYRLNVTANNGDSYLIVGEIEMMKQIPAGDMTLQSNATTAEAQPDDAFIVLWQEDVDSVTPNTDIKAWASRDGGTTWTQITLAEDANLSTGRILTGSADISGQPSGTSMKWKATTHNGKDQRIHGVGLEWR